MHRYYWSTLGLSSPLVYDGSAPSNEVPFSGFTLNVGDQCICGAHRDGCNLSCGLCLASPFGNFDYRKGGHLILHELRLVFELPPGSFILFPSALITHENIPVAEAEFRQSITGFTPGTLFQWVDNGFRRINEMRLPRLNLKENWKRKRCMRHLHVKTSNSELIQWSRMTSRFPHILSFNN
jgi:hypothetical protein